MLDFDKLQTPGEGQILIEPPPTDWPRLLSNNIRARRDFAFTLAGEPAKVAVAEVRATLADGPLVACGHQPAFVHPGVWAKHVVVHHAAESLGTGGLDFVVDNDAPPSSTLLVPTVKPDGFVIRREVPIVTYSHGSAYEGHDPITSSDVARIESELSDLIGPRFDSSLLPEYLLALATTPNPTDFVAQHIAARTAVDAPLEADLAEARVSDAFGGLFLADLLLNPEPFAIAYNQALTKYRQERAVRGPDRPLPDLGQETERTETALWIYQPLAHRRRLWVRRAGDTVELFADMKPVAAIAARDLAHQPDATLATLRPWVIRPRALTLTLWARLLACDLFVHGIGGAKYDRITDDIIRRYYRCPPPAYVCVSATLRLSLPRFPAALTTCQTARRELRDWHYNPQRYLQNAPRDLLAERERLIRLAGHLRATRAPRGTRRETRFAIRRLNTQLTELDAQREPALRARVARLERELASNAVAHSREFFYCLYPRASLAELAQQLKQSVHPH